MILVVTPNLRANECVTALRQAANEEVVLVESLRKAASLLRTQSYLVVVVDQFLLETEPDETEIVMQHLGTAIPVQVNLAISGVERVTREVRAAVQRHKREEIAARQSALSTLHSELNGTVTALLLSCELALKVPGLPSEAIEKIESAHRLIQKLRSQLQAGNTGQK